MVNLINDKNDKNVQIMMNFVLKMTGFQSER